MSLEITNIQINKVKHDKILAFAKITLNEAICIDGIKIINGEKGIFIGMPSNKTKEGKFKDIVFPINAETRKMLTEKILKVYDSKGNTTDDEPF